ncbi:MAG: hypothetical protein V1821_03380 [bacterium]
MAIITVPISPIGDEVSEQEGERPDNLQQPDEGQGEDTGLQIAPRTPPKPLWEYDVQ